ncbi:MAG: hypothetical protein QG656_1398 [Candidatus Hydrogenedentes bacterium]|nr:hypothetical protein [Candidatus Hydrogenedentota bacterium]
MNRTIVFGSICILGGLALCGCQTCPAPTTAQAPAKPSVMTAKYTAEPVAVDGNLDDPVWVRATVYPLYLGDDADPAAGPIQEGGEVRLAWDKEFLYVGVRYFDSDIVAEGTEDQMLHFLQGDVAEVFLKPAQNTWYWELYVTPHGKKSSLWFPGRGRMGLKSDEQYPMDLRVAAACQGTFGDWRDRDTSWTGEMAIPAAELTKYGDAFGPGAAWSILVARYNYSRYLTTRGAELTMTPKLPITSYHYHEGYATLELEQ